MSAITPVAKGATPQSSDVNQLLNWFLGNLDLGEGVLPPPVSNPSGAPTVAENGAGNLSGVFFCYYTYVTGFLEDNGVIVENGESELSPPSPAITLSNQQMIWSGINPGSLPVIATRLYRSIGLPDPTTPLSLSTSAQTSTLAATTYYINNSYGNYNAPGYTTPGSSEASIAIPTANTDAIVVTGTIPTSESNANELLLGFGTASGAEAQYAVINLDTQQVTYVGSNTSGITATISGTTFTITITAPPTDTSNPMPTTNDSNLGNPQLVTTLAQGLTTYNDNVQSPSGNAPTTNTTGSSLVVPKLSAWLADPLGTAGNPAYPGSTMAPNLLQNSSWRLGSAYWHNTGINGFSVLAATQGGRLYNGQSPGASSVQVDNSLNKVAALPNTVYTLSGDMDATGVSAGSMWIQWFAFDSNGNSLWGGEVGATNGASYRRYSTTFTTPANTASLQIACGLNANTVNTGASWGNLKLEIGASATPYTAEGDLWPLANGGSFVPYLAGQTQLLSVTTTSVVTPINATAPAAGLYAFFVWASVNNGTSGQDISFWLEYGGGNFNFTFAGSGGASQPVVSMTGSTSIPNGTYMGFPTFHFMNGGDGYTLAYHDPAGTPNDTIGAALVRLA